MALGFYNSDEINDLKNKISNLEQQLNLITTDYFEISKNKSEEIINLHQKSNTDSLKISELLTAIDSSYKKLQDQLNNLDTSIEKSIQSENKTSLLINDCEVNIAEIKAIKDNFNNYENNIKNILEEANNYLESSSKLPEALEKAKTDSDEVENTLKQSKQALQNIINKKKEIDDIYSSINGYDLPDENSPNEIQHIEGLKDILEKSYQSIDLKIKSLNDIIDNEVNEIKDSYNTLLSTAKNQYESLDKELNGLLPGAMAKGLSDAFETKRSSEQETLNTLETHFKYAILALIATALIPILADCYLLYYKDKDLLDVIKETPNILLATLPIYLPLLWFAHSTNKKSNLSKRLIEEYTHKSVLGKTFSGLSNQIDNLPNQNNIREELRIKLLFNLLQVSAENPGKLITDYNKSDHPILDVIQKSGQLSESLENLSNIPGISLISKKISEKFDRDLEEASLKVRKGIDFSESLDNNKENKCSPISS